MGNQNRATRRRSKTSEEQLFRPTVQPTPLNKFGTVVLALWPDKPGLNLAQRAKCSERHANLLIEGKRKPNARAALAVYAEIIG